MAERAGRDAGGTKENSLQRRAKFQHPLASPLHARSKLERRRRIQQQNHPIQLALSSPPSQRQTNRMKQLPAAKSHFHLQRLDNFLESLRIDRRSVENKFRQL